MQEEVLAASGLFSIGSGGEKHLAGRGRARGFWQGSVASFLNNESTIFVQTKNEDSSNYAFQQQGQFDDAEVQEELEAHVRHKDNDGGDVTDFQAPNKQCQKVRDQETAEESESGENSMQRSNNDKSKRYYQKQTESAPSDDRKSVKNRYDAKQSQQKRREELLDSQKQRRDEILDKIRQLEASSDSCDSELEEDEDFVKLVKENKLQRISEDNETNESDKMDTTAGDENRQQRRRNYKRPNKNLNSPCRVMLSEWLIEKPLDFDENWMGMLCPVGKRCLVVASRRKTCVFSRTHEYMGVFQSRLPGGCKVNGRDPEMKKKKGVTILDCVWSMDAEVFYVLDLVCWASQSYNNCDKAYRQFFQTSKISESPYLMERSPSNPYPFLPLPSFECSQIAEVMMTTLPIFKQKVDGVLFFHKESFYINGVNPLCLWIYLTDMELKLQVSVAPELVALQRPKREPRPRVEGSTWRNHEKQKPMEV